MKLCNCENQTHFDGGPDHDYLAVPAGAYHADFVGAICDECALGHYAEFVIWAGPWMGPRLQQAYAEAMGWIHDSFEDAPEVMTPQEIKAGINRHYEGGWDALITALQPLFTDTKE